ncbi:MAG: IS630 family transposase, partial [Oligoflexia bacterium]|nr:IS630 family transposase [Oligoflexia bacterium]
RSRRYADRIRVILLLDEGHTYKDIAHFLFIDEGTIANYIKRYKEGGIEGLIIDDYQGGSTKLTMEQEFELDNHLQEKIHTSAKEIIHYVKKKYGVTFSVSGMKDLLHRLGFSFKKPKVVPGKSDKEKQEEFINSYEDLKESLSEGEKIYFADAAHPSHNNNPVHGWIKKGEEKEILTNSGRQRINLNGALCLDGLEIMVNTETTINQDAMKNLLERLRKANPIGDKIYVILDNATYNRAYEVQSFANFLNIELIYLLSYSPNLNIIERLWKFFHKKVRNNKYSSDFEKFKLACLDFFKDIKKYKPELKTLLTDNFQRISSHALKIDR